MATYTELDPADRAVLDAFVNQFRAGEGELARLLRRLGVLKDDYAVQVGAIVATLDAGALIPNAGGLAGAGAVSKEELGAAATDLNAILTTYDTDAKRQEYVKFAGPQNVLG